MFGRFQMWMKSGKQKDTTQLLMLVKGDAKNVKADLNDLPPQYNKDLKVLKQGHASMCGGTQPGEQLIAEGNDRNGKRSQIEMSSTVIGNNRYIAMYVRPSGMRPDSQAESALNSLCPAK